MSQPWNLPDRDITNPVHVLSRRRWLGRIALGGTVLGIGGGCAWWWYRGSDRLVLESGRVEQDIRHYPAPPNERFESLDRPLTFEPDAARYCNFYEFSRTKEVWRYVHPFQPHPWVIEVAGLVQRPLKLDLDEVLRLFPLQERNYRHRCVETWAMAIPWTGFPLAALLKLAEPLATAKYVQFTTFHRPTEASRQQVAHLPWPYTEGLTLAEAGNELTFLATGMYGHPLLKQHGAPIRLVVPWKYGFKSAKSITRIELTAEQPATFWNTIAPHEYTFEANVNPRVPHPRWSQKNEHMLGTGEVRPTQPFNGYGEWVAQLYRR